MALKPVESYKASIHLSALVNCNASDQVAMLLMRSALSSARQEPLVGSHGLTAELPAWQCDTTGDNPPPQGLFWKSCSATGMHAM